ncbi:hypothetical protein XMKAXML_00089 [Enterococcus phage vB_OCPT_PG13]|uniref:Uncharacterized protein n=1 Tax=Enterococcus phage IMEEF1 TaxID=1351735 RepID=S5MEJ2_9CAUD|nr:hypothetical protein AVT94_gp86 [Enterococcus phage vB_EfaS_IME198]YP_009603924.1 hypothetical protein FDH83_gp41 [Enterococcus phage IMEEF1]QAY01558.1 hypothetical protein EfsWh1_87 [Enterococcus phage EfsWh-1]UQT00768.1 hypothetical protein [Enterococcus phage vB_OCPT_SDS1]UQT00975.1 hypothetical protein POQMFEI_00049 [Enterococcus phage vB_OCPT_CCS2]UQT01294.1 hypothetical protein EMSIMAW_00011 [Enterococcus phage vB_OCPT_PG2]UQT01654.1 hypothetical protein XMKAXML_00089 [Enterococcus p
MSKYYFTIMVGNHVMNFIAKSNGLSEEFIDSVTKEIAEGLGEGIEPSQVAVLNIIKLDVEGRLERL